MAFQGHFISRDDDKEEADQDPPNEIGSLERQLSDFRQRWQKEIQASGPGSESQKDSREGSPNSSVAPAPNQTKPAVIKSNRPNWSSGDAPATVSSPSFGLADPKPVSGDDKQQQLHVAEDVAENKDSNQPKEQQQVPTGSTADQGAPRKEEEEDENANAAPKSEETIESKAKKLFIQGVCAERRGNLTEAICKYRHAIQLVPDIESKITDYTVKEEDTENDIQEGFEDEDFDSSPGDEDVLELESELRALTTNDIKSHCDPEFQQTSTHISALPVELLLHIFRWVVSSELDIRSLELLSMVCRGFYVCARDPSLWHRACQRVYGQNCCLTKEYTTWRQMYVESPHPHFHGVYINRNTYFRKGEPDMDGLYRPWHMVEYYRYIRLFPDGAIMMYSAPEEPQQVVSKLRNQTTPLQSVLIGRYTISGDMITGMLRRENTKVYDNHLHRYIRYKRQMTAKLDTEHTFHLELCIRSRGHHPNYKLDWHSYSCHTHHRPTGNTNVTEFDVDKKFKPLVFSRVKSYTKTSEKPL